MDVEYVFQTIGAIATAAFYTAIFAVMMYAFYLASKASKTPVRKPPRAFQRPAPDYFAAVKATDPAFTWEGLCARAVSAYQVIQRARMVRQPKTAAHWVTPELLAGLENDSAFSASHDVDRTLAPITMGPITARNVRSDGSEFHIDLQMSGLMPRRVRDAIFGIAEPRIADELMDKQVLISEIWTFSRPIGSTTGAKVPDGFSHCPHCGAPVEDPRVARCQYCDQSLYDGAGDWMVSEITPIELSPTFSPQRPASQMGVS